MGIETSVAHGKQPLRPPPAARGDLEKVVPYAVSNRAAQRNLWR